MPLPISAALITPKARLEAVKPVSVMAAKPQPPKAAPQIGALRQLSISHPSSLFDGSVLSAPSVDDTPSLSEPVAAARRRDVSVRFNSRLARWTGVSAVWSLYRDGILVQRHAARLADPALSPARRAASARLLASYGRLESVPALGFAVENDASARVRRAAKAALLQVALPAEAKLLRALKTNPRPSAREAAATALSWIVRHEASARTVEALADAGMLDPSEDVRLSAIRSLSLARAPRALASLEWMLVRETRPHMRSALELAAAEARRRDAGAALLRPASDEDLSDTRGPLHEVALKRATAVASVFVAVALIGGFVTGSVALKADAMHLAADQLLNVAALFAIWMARRPPNSRKSYGYLKVESIVGLLGSGAIAFMGWEMGGEAWHRFFEPGAAAT